MDGTTLCDSDPLGAHGHGPPGCQSRRQCASWQIHGTTCCSRGPPGVGTEYIENRIISEHESMDRYDSKSP